MRSIGVLTCLFLIMAARAADGAKVPPSLTGPERSPEWLGAVERIRLQPRPGEIQNGGVQCHIVEIVAPSEALNVKAAEIQKRYEAEAIQQLAACEAELKKIRAKYEAEVLQTLPEARREAAGKALAISHEHWHTPLEVEAKLRAALLERKAKSPNAALTGREAIKAARDEMSAWIRAEHKRLTATDAQALEGISQVLDADEKARLQEYNREREVPVKTQK